ncbi:bifunctional non-homologous end joining protein LigD [Evansella vedderi]|uniref:DNA ligase (ATP) n=1 Tax=Evansella vedderi TaxID=38282 RepID=A0ABU0A4P8_9BACI|nr:RNA ligase family protein [Evansella vedderi]MDQ0258084.1 bifunctional non-homologous end joining protein LigD [Evansella vedderi]
MDLELIIPFEPMSSSTVPAGEDWTMQMKWDGVRIVTYYDGKETRLYNRKQNERTQHFPELLQDSYCKANSVILDGEVIALGEHGRPSFHQVMRRDALRKLDKVQMMKNVVPVYYMIFDVVYYNGRWINELPLRERMALLSEIIEPTPNIQLTTSYEDGESLYKVTEQQGMEGIVAKKLNSKYELGGKNNNWIKIKNFQDIIAVIGGVTYRNGVVNAVLLGLYDESGNLHYVGHAGTGKLTQEDWQLITQYVEKLKVEERPFINEPDRLNNSQWISPQLTVKIQYIEWPKGRSIRQPSIQAFTSVPPEECKLPQ